MRVGPPGTHAAQCASKGLTMQRHSVFSQLARRVARLSGRPASFAIACAVIVLWALSGPIFHFNDTWQLVINTGTTIITFLMVFLIQSTQNSDTEAIQIKLDELIRAIEPARNRMLSLEELDETELDELRKEFDELAKKARQT
ncbi:low affinity iron permease family protein [Comamonas sp. 4034]|uniref:low affinity iron permease family protein n=1 Tax=Comamonas sp. 4034 TaxID=3156455 RepID=UPI003D190D2C